jgi:hypothetical protein
MAHKSCGYVLFRRGVVMPVPQKSRQRRSESEQRKILAADRKRWKNMVPDGT